MPKTLTETEVAEIEARLKTWTSGGRYPASWNEIDALCRSLRAAWAKYERLKSKIAWHRDGIGPDVPVLQERYNRLITDRIALRDQLQEEQNRNQIQADSIMDCEAEITSLRAQLAQVEKERSTVWERAIRLVHGEAESAANRARRIRDRYGDEGADEESAETLACETARNIKRALERAARMDSEGITEEDIAETLNPTRYPEKR